MTSDDEDDMLEEWAKCLENKGWHIGKFQQTFYKEVRSIDDLTNMRSGKPDKFCGLLAFAGGKCWNLYFLKGPLEIDDFF